MIKWTLQWMRGRLFDHHIRYRRNGHLPTHPGAIAVATKFRAYAVSRCCRVLGKIICKRKTEMNIQPAMTLREAAQAI